MCGSSFGMMQLKKNQLKKKVKVDGVNQLQWETFAHFQSFGNLNIKIGVLIVLCGNALIIFIPLWWLSEEKRPLKKKVKVNGKTNWNGNISFIFTTKLEMFEVLGQCRKIFEKLGPIARNWKWMVNKLESFPSFSAESLKCLKYWVNVGKFNKSEIWLWEFSPCKTWAYCKKVKVIGR